MGHTTTNVLVHFIFSTHNRTPLITVEIESDLHAYLGGIIREIGGVALCINGMTDHIHILVRMPSSHSVADVARLIKTNSSRWIHERWPHHKNFRWQVGYRSGITFCTNRNITRKGHFRMSSSCF